MVSPTRDERQALLQSKRALKMARSTHAYVRGNTAKFYEWLERFLTVLNHKGIPVAAVF